MANEIDATATSYRQACELHNTLIQHSNAWTSDIAKYLDKVRAEERARTIEEAVAIAKRYQKDSAHALIIATAIRSLAKEGV